MAAAGSPRWVALRALAASQHGLATHRQLEDVGFPRSTVARLVVGGQLIRVAPGVLALPGGRQTDLQRAAAAVLGHEHVAVTGWSAAWLWQLVPAAPSVVHVVAPAGRRGPQSRGTRVRRSSTLVPADVTEVHGIPVVTVARMLTDLAGEARLPALRRLAIDGRQRRLLRVEDVARVAARAGRTRGIGAVHELVAELSEGRCDSILEHTARVRLARAGFRPHPAPYPVRIDGTVLHLDIAFPPQQVALEPEGLGFHSSRASLARDQARANLLARTDWKILRIGWHDVECRFDAVATELAALLRARGWRPG